MLPRDLDDEPATDLLEIAAFLNLRNRDNQDRTSSDTVERLARERTAEEIEDLLAPPVLGMRRPTSVR